MRGGAHPVGTENALVRGPQPGYVELIAAGGDESNPWLDRVRSARGPISWAIAVDDVEASRAAAPLPFLIQWTTPWLPRRRRS